MDPKELIEALGVLVDPNASDEDKAAALEKLSAHFNSLLDSATEETTDEAESTSEAASETSETDKPKDEPSKEMASALATIKTLNERLAKLEKASAIGAAPRAAKPTVLPRKAEVPVTDPTLQMINAAAANTRRNASK